MKMRNVHQINRNLMASILFDRITKRDCLDNGWILVGYVSSAADLEIMEKQFHIIPNKYIHFVITNFIGQKQKVFRLQ